MKIRNIKILSLLMLVFLLSGCSVEYSLVINEDSSLNEKIIASENTKRLESKTKLKGTQACNYLYDMFKRNDENASISCTEDNGITSSNISFIHDNIESYVSDFSSDIFKKLNITKDDNKTTITSIQNDKLGTDSGTSYLYDDIKISITVPFVVSENNADSKSGNVYTWYIKKNSEVKTIKLTYEDKKLPNRANIKINDNQYNLRYEYFLIGGIVLTIIIIVVFVFVKNKKNNVL